MTTFISDFLSSHFPPSAPDKAKRKEDGICSICGAVGNHLFVDDVLDPSSGKLCEFMRFGDRLICPQCTTMWIQPKVFHRSIFATSKRLAMPLIAPEGTVKKAVVANPRKRSELQDHSDRPLWRELLRDRSWWDSERVAVLSTDGQRRVWHKARLSQGDNLAIVLHDLSRGVSDCVVVNLPTVVKCLDTVELIYSNGYSKTAIETNLLGNAKDIRQALEFERMVQPLRGCSEFLLAVIVAQKDVNLQQPIQAGGLATVETVGSDRSTVFENAPKAIKAA